MKRKRFALTSDQMELLLAFEAAGNLEKLADAMARDASVISRNLQKLALEYPVLVKTAGRWKISPLGREVNRLSRIQVEKLENLLAKPGASKIPAAAQTLANAMLVVVNAQKGFHDPAHGRGSNAEAEAEKNISLLLNFWRKKKRPLVHIKHVSEDPGSFFYRKSSGVDFIENLSPRVRETVLEKSKASAFAGTNLEKLVLDSKATAVVLVGFTGGECIDASARQANELGLQTYVVGDATASFDVVGPKGKVHKAAKIHKSTLANLHALFAEVIETDSILR